MGSKRGRKNVLVLANKANREESASHLIPRMRRGGAAKEKKGGRAETPSLPLSSYILGLGSDRSANRGGQRMILIIASPCVGGRIEREGDEGRGAPPYILYTL